MDFREQVRKNRLKTRLVILTFIAIMVLVGLLTDVVVNPVVPDSLSQSLMAYLTLQAKPYMTVLILAVTLSGIGVIHIFGGKMMLAGMKAKELKEGKHLTSEEIQVLNIVEEMSISANLGYIPKVYVMEDDQLNAFAAGWSERNALVGVTRGLLDSMNRAETQAVMAHEIGHILHGDSKLTLYVGILANVILTVTNIFSNILILMTNRSSASNKAGLLIFVLNMILPIITKVLYFYLSRSREYMADATAVRLTGDNQAMISALRTIENHHSIDEKVNKDMRVGEHFRNASYIFEKGDSVFSTHPSIENRIKLLEGIK